MQLSQLERVFWMLLRPLGMDCRSHNVVGAGDIVRVGDRSSGWRE